jgi:hypothetical protein
MFRPQMTHLQMAVLKCPVLKCPILKCPSLNSHPQVPHPQVLVLNCRHAIVLTLNNMVRRVSISFFKSETNQVFISNYRPSIVLRSMIRLEIFGWSKLYFIRLVMIAKK